MNPTPSTKDKYISFRSSYQTFYFEDYNIDVSDNEISVTYHFSIDRKMIFKPQFRFRLEDYCHIGKVEKEDLDNLVFQIGMVEVISYWKSVCPKYLVIEVAQLDAIQIEFWKKLYFNGLGEFFYLNGIPAKQDDFMEIKSVSDKAFKPFSMPELNGVVIPVGGGKDSVVTLELLKTKRDAIAMIVNPRGASLSTAKMAGFDEDKVFVIKRGIDPYLLELNKEGYLNGHTPFSSLLAFQSLLVAAITGKKDIALSNEGSANEATVIGTNVNHQYSKSYEFESDFRAYVAQYVSPDFNYYSFLRPLSEFQIACLFAQYSHQHPHFRSCNVGSKEDKWCCACPKCLFTYIILSPFLSLSELITIYGEDLLNKESLLKDFEELCGIADVKPFECVGTIDEVKLGICFARSNYPDNELSYLLRHFEKVVGFDATCAHIDMSVLLSQMEDEHFLSSELFILLKEKLGEYAAKN